VIARPGARDLAERDGLGGIHSALRALIEKVEGVAPADDAAVREPSASSPNSAGDEAA
jgi:hypothetical protein